MKRLFAFLIFLPNFLLAQKHDYIWTSGYDSYSNDLRFGGMNISFVSEAVKTDRIERPMNIQTGFNVAMSDTNGHLQFYSNGCYIANLENDTIENGTGINPGYVHDLKCPGSGSNGYTSGFQSGLALPTPDTVGVYFMFHKRIIYLSVAPYVLTDQLLYSTVDMNQNSGKGKVTAKNVVAVADSAMGYGGLTAVRHANGRDWWVISPGFVNNNYYLLLVTKNGVAAVKEQQIGDPTPESVEGGGQSFFTPDGKTYIRSNSLNKIRMFDFDRATGTLSNYRRVNVNFGSYNPIGVAAGVSPSGRFLYVTVRKYLYQLDLQASDIEASQVLLDEWDGYGDPIACDFWSVHSGPDCKLYISTGNGSRIMHVVHHPDDLGLDCDFEQRGLHTSTYYGAPFPNFPNYRLKAVGEPFSPCKGYTVGQDEVVFSPLPAVSVFPNPASEYVKVVPNRPLPVRSHWVLYDAYGREVRSERVDGASNCTESDVQGLAGGVYFWSLVSGEGRAVASGKLIVRH
jgi:hypothetical protein